MAVQYKDFFDGSDRELILQAIRDMRDLRVAVKDFNDTVTGPHQSNMDKQMSELAKSIQMVAAASRDLNITNAQSQKTLSDNLGIIEKLRAENDALRKSKAGAKQAEDALAGSVDGLNNRLKDLIRQYRAVDQSTESGHLQAEKYAASIRQTKEEINGMMAATKSTTSIMRAAAGSYNELDAQTKQLIKDYRALGDIEGVNKEKAELLSKQIFDNTAKLKQYDQTLNQNFRNVGNYRSAFDGLGMSVNQLTRELPAFTNSIQTGFLAISNNLPILADQLRLASDRTKALRAEGQAAPSVFSQLVKALFSWQTAMSLGITLLTVFGASIIKWIGSLFNAGKGIDYLKLKQETLNGVMNEADKSAGKEIAKLNILYKAATDVTLPMNQRLRAVEALKAAFPDYFAKLDNEIILNGKAQKTYEDLYKAIIKTSQARAASSKLDELEAQRLQIEQQKSKIINATTREIGAVKAPIKEQASVGALLAGGTGTGTTSTPSVEISVEEQKNRITLRRNLALKEQDDLLKKVNAQEKFLVDFVGQENLINVSGGSDQDLEKQRKKQEEERKKKQREEDQDQKRLEQAIRKQDELIQASAKYRIALAEQEFAKSAQTAEDEVALEQKKKDIILETTNLRLKLYKEGSKEQQAILAEQVKAETDYMEKVRQIREKDAQRRTDLRLKDAAADFDKTKKGWTDEIYYEEKRLQILEDGFNERLALYNKDSDEYKKILADKTEAEAQTAARIRKIREDQDKARIEAEDSGHDVTESIITGNIRKQAASHKITQDEAERQLHLERVAQIQDEIDAKQKQLDKAKEGDADYYQYLKELNGLKKELIDENSNYEIDQAQKVHDAKKELEQAAFDFAVSTAGQLFDLGRDLNQSNIDALGREKDKELELAGNNAQARKKIEENYQKEILKLKRKQAIYDKVQALFNIAISTAQGVAAALANPLTAPFMIPFVIATGAIQAAVVLARPLPQAAKGKKKGQRGGDYEVNEQGWELIRDDQGRYRVANRGARGVTKLAASDTVYTHEESRRILHEFINTEDSMGYMRSLLKGTGIILKHERAKEDRMVNAFAASQLSEGAIERAMSKAVQELPLEVWQVDEKGARKYVKELAGKVESLNSRMQLGQNG